MTEKELIKRLVSDDTPDVAYQLDHKVYHVVQSEIVDIIAIAIVLDTIGTIGDLTTAKVYRGRRDFVNIRKVAKKPCGLEFPH